MNYIVFYTKDASPQVKQFKTLLAAKRFANRHEKKNIMLYSDDWVDCIIEGNIVKTYPNWYDKDVEEK